MTRTHKFVRVATAGLAVFALAACSSPAAEPSTTLVTEDPVVEKSELPVPEVQIPETVYPLTGVDAEGVDAALLARPAIAVKIENTEAARPQTNIEFADIVFEEYVEYGISRLVAVFHSNFPETVGPIRSMRPMDPAIVGSFGGPLVFSGAAGPVLSEARATGQELLAEDVGSSGFFRVRGKSAPHNLHGTMERFLEQTDASAPTQQFNYAYEGVGEVSALGGTDASTIKVRMSRNIQPQWKWDATAATWQRFERDTPHVAESGTQITAKNVVALFVEVRYVHGYLPETLLSGKSGSGYVAAGGKYLAINWSKDSRTGNYVLTTEDGGPVLLEQGNTWIELVPTSGANDKGTVEFE